MALDPKTAFARQEILRPLPTGLSYRAREDITGFELPPRVSAALAAQLTKVNRYHQRPDCRVLEVPVD